VIFYQQNLAKFGFKSLYVKDILNTCNRKPKQTKTYLSYNREKVLP